MNELGRVLRWSMTCVMLVGGCGKTDESGAGDDDGSDADSRPLADLSDAEVSDVCEQVWQLYEDMVPAYERGICIVESVESASDGASCEAAVNECVDNLEIIVTSIDECTATLDFAGCEATVGELNECIAEQRQQVERIAGLQSCEDAVSEGASAEEWLEDVPACERLVDRCPAAFEGPSSDVDDSEVAVPPVDTPHVIAGDVDGTAVEIRPNGGLMQSHSATSEAWSTSLEFGGAALWLWGEVETAQGLLRMPPTGSEAPSWLCLDTVEIEHGTETSTWQSDKVSMLPACGEGDSQPFELTFAVGYPVSGVLQGEALSWVSAGFSCGSTCRFEFQAADTAWTGLDRWILEIDTSIEAGVSKAFERSTLIHPSGAGVVACGGGGVLTHRENEEIQIVVDALGPLSHCPGTPVEGELTGVY